MWERVREAEGIKDLNLAITALYKIIGYSHITQDTVNYATHLINNYEGYKTLQYIRKLERDISDLISENRELRKQADL